jgi:hypothetical protein
MTSVIFRLRFWGRFSPSPVKETTARQQREEKKFGEYVYVRTRQSAIEHHEASSNYFALALVNQLDEVVSQSMIL